MIKAGGENSIVDMVEISLDDLARIKDVSRSIREFNRQKFPAPREYCAHEIRRLRKKLHVSQSVLAHLLNTKVTTVQKWERGVNSPNGPANRLLQLIEKRGFQALMV